VDLAQLEVDAPAREPVGAQLDIGAVDADA
jgi:hypothetical protein